MATSPNQPISSSSEAASVRRHHTISAHTRSARASARDVISEETNEQPQQGNWNEDEVVDDDWVGGVGAVGEKSSLHRQASLPTRYHRAFQGQAAKTSNQTVNSLAAIESNDVDEELWKLGTCNIEDDEQVPLEEATQIQVVDDQSQTNISPFTNNPATVPSPPPAASSVRRHVSITYGAVGGQQRKSSAGLKRSGTLQNPMPAHSQQSPTPPETSEQLEAEEYAYEEEDHSPYQDDYPKNQYPSGPIGASSLWPSGNEWKPAPTGNGSTAIDDVQRALTRLEIASNPSNGTAVAPNNYEQYQQQPSAVQPPRFNTAHQHHSSGSRGSNGGGGGYYHNNGGRGSEYDGRKTPISQRGGYIQQQQYGQQDRSGTWNQNEQNLRGRVSNPNLQYGYQQQVVGNHAKASSGGVPSVPPIPPQYLQQGNQNSRQVGITAGFPDVPAPHVSPVPSGQVPTQTFLETPVDVPTLIATKGYNPVQFDIRPAFARYFVIKSYTEDDVHKSLKYEIWSSTDPGNKRLDKAFKETAGRGPIYLFFSVNASGHFCGMAEMLTPVDYTRSSTVWASDKWKGVFKVRWIFVRDIPNVTLRHIKLMNTSEKKPVTNSRDTQELLPDAGQEMLRIFHTHPARTSLLQDFAFYELQSMQKAQAGGNAGTPPVLSSPQLQAATTQNNSTGFNSYNMGMGPGGPYGASQQSLHPQAQVMHQSVMRHPSPVPQPQGNYGPPF